MDEAIVDEILDICQCGYDSDSNSDDKNEVEEELPHLIVVSDFVAATSTPLPEWMPNYITQYQT